MTSRPGDAMTAAPSRRAGHAAVIAVVTTGVVALIVRTAAFVFPESILWMRENDDGVMFAGTIAMLHGLAPYADFDFVHPPGSLLTLTPFALLGAGTTEAVGLAGARLLTVAVGVANTVLIGLLLRRFGASAVLIGGGLYAVWGTAVVTEQTYLLEPYLNLFLLVALFAITFRWRFAPFIAGASLGLALASKYWAVVDVVIVGWMIWVAFGRAAFARYVAAGAVTAGLLALPFLFRDPGAMWSLTVTAQLERGGNEVDLAERADVFSPYLAFPTLRELIPTAASALGVALLPLVAALPLIEMGRARRRPGAWSDEAWWGLITLAHAILLAVASMFFYHYAAWLMAPLALSLGAAVGRLRRARVRHLVLAGGLVILMLMAAGDLVRVRPTPSATQLQEWAAGRECVAGMPSTLVAADRVGADLDHGCPMDVDPLSLGMTLPNAGSLSHRGLIESDEWQARWWSYIEGADAAVITPGQREWLSPTHAAEFEAAFVQDGTIGDHELWRRPADAPAP
ncbi:hypothetical protein [Agromyces bauzanensis]|nr:hypothetical protein [Agromyces bauzanensis]